jgi:hypothetical protein
MKRFKLLFAGVFALLLIGFVSCSEPKSKEETQKEIQEIKQVDKTLESDQQRADSMKKALKID